MLTPNRSMPNIRFIFSIPLAPPASPKGVVHVHGGYMVGTAYHLRNFFDVKDNDVYWATSDIGWVVGHSYIVYAPLVEGVTSVFREGAPDFPHPGVIWEGVWKSMASMSCLRRRQPCACL